jgi:hypothetical protein
VKRALVAGAAAIAALLVLEVALRLGDYATPDLYQLDPDLGWSLRRHKSGWYAGEEGRVRIAVNGAGFRDREHKLDKPGPVYRIAILGDEYSQAPSVALQDTWWWRLEPKLQQCDFQAGKLVEVLNFGVSGYGTAQELVLLQSTVMRYAPDLVLVEVAPDDVADNSYALARNKLRPFYSLDVHGVAHIDESFADAREFDRHMQTRYRLAAEIGDHVRSFQLVRELARTTFIAPAHAEFIAPSGPAYEDAWRITEALLAKMTDFARRNGAELALVAVPPPHVSYPDQHLDALGARLGVRVIALAPAMQSAYYRPSGAWTAAGHRAAAAEVAARLCGTTARPD